MNPDIQNRAISRALQAQYRTDGENRRAPAVSDLRSLAETHFREAMTAATDEYLTACNSTGRMAVIDKLDASGNDRFDARRYFGGQVLGFEDQPRVHLGSRMMSYELQKSQDPSSTNQSSRSTNRVQASYPRGWDHKKLTLGNLQTEGMEDLVRDSLEDMGVLEVLLLLNRLANPGYSNEISTAALRPAVLRPRTFDMSCPRESEVESTFRPIVNAAVILLEVLQPGITVSIGSDEVVGGRADIAVAVEAYDELLQRRRDYQAMIELKKPGIAFRAANILAFGDPPADEDFEALRETIGPMRDEKLEHTAEQLERFATMPPLKRIAVQNGNRPEYRYTCDGADVTAQLRMGYFLLPLNSALAGCEQVSRYASRNRCRHMAISDGPTFIGMHLRDLEELQPRFVTANLNSHAAVDLTEDRSALWILLYLINAPFRDARVRDYVGTLLEAAAEHFDDGEITPERVASFRALMGNLQNYRFHSGSYPQDTSLDGSGGVYTSHSVSVIGQALTHFNQAYGSIVQSGEYDSSSIETLEKFRVNVLQGIPYGASPIPGRSRSVSKVIFHGISDADHELFGSPKPCVLKVYDADTASIGRMERELEAYSRLAQLNDRDQKRIARLLAFGALDLEGMDPRLFIAIEYVEDSHAGEPPLHTRQHEITKHELDKVCGIFKSVGVYHNDLEERNYKWQLKDGERYIKVFDFDHATFDSVKPAGPSRTIKDSQSPNTASWRKGSTLPLRRFKDDGHPLIQKSTDMTGFGKSSDHSMSDN